MPQTPISNAIFPNDDYISPSSTGQATAYENCCGQTNQFPDVNVLAGVTTTLTDRMRNSVLVRNGSGVDITPGMALNWVSSYWGTRVQACPAGSPIRCFAPSYVRGSISTVIPDGAFFYAVQGGPCSPLSDGTAIAINDGIVVGAASGKVAKELALGGGLVYAATADSTAIASTATLTAFSNSYTFPANTLRVGDVIRIRAQCPITWNSGQLTLRLLIGTTVLCTTGAITNATGDTFYVDCELVIRTIGASGTLVATSNYVDGVVGNATASAVAGATAHTYPVTSTAIDTTATQLISLDALWSVSNSGNSVLNRILEVERVNTNTNGLKAGTAIAAAALGSAVQFRANVNCQW